MADSQRSNVNQYKSDSVGVIGTGNMGAALVVRLLDAGFTVVAFDKNAAALDSVRNRGAIAVSSPRDLADAAEIVIACLPSGEACLDAALGIGGASDGKKIEAYIETSTVGLATIQAVDAGLKSKEVVFLDAPISGGPRAAYAGTLSMMISGTSAARERTEHVLSAIAQNIFCVGDQPGFAQICKLVNNAISITGLSVACEAIVMGVKAGLDATTLIDVVNASTGRNSATVDKFPKSILPRTFDYGSPLETGAKDMGLYLEEARRLGVTAQIGTTVSQLWQYALSQGAAKHDATTLIQHLERLAGVEVAGRRNDSRSR